MTTPTTPGIPPHLLRTLKGRALRVLLAMQVELATGAPLNIPAIMERTGYEERAARNGVRDLIRAGVIRRRLNGGAPPQYWPAPTLAQTNQHH